MFDKVCEPDKMHNSNSKVVMDPETDVEAKSVEKNSECCKSNNEKEHEYEDVLQLIGFGRVQWIVLFASGLFLMMVINETMGMSIITIVSQCEFNMRPIDRAVMSAASFVGIFCSSYYWGYLSDTVGRRPVLIYTTLSGNILSIVSIFIPNYWIFVVVRFFVGFFIAGASSTTYAYLGEFFTPRHRPVVINYASMFVGISTVYVPAVAWLIMPMDWSFAITESFIFRPWRLLSAFNLLPGVVATLMLCSLPESPKMLLSQRKYDEAFAAVNWIAQRNSGKQLHELKVERLKMDSGSNTTTTLLKLKSTFIKKMWQETRPLFKSPHRLNFVISCTVMCGLFFSSSGMGLWYPDIQNRLGSKVAEDAMTVCNVIDVSIEAQSKNITTVCNDVINPKTYVDTITYGLALCSGYIVMGLVINPIGRKLAVFGSLAIASCCSLALMWIMDETIIVVLFCLYLVLPGLCVSVLSGAVVDLVPTHLRGKAVCICLMLGRSGSVFGSNIIGVLLESYCTATFGVFSGFVLFCAALTLLLPI